MLLDIVIESFESAVAHGASPGNILSAFRKCGLVPFNPRAVCESDFVLQEMPEEAMMSEAFSTSHHLTSPEGLEWLAQKECGCSAAEAEAQFGDDPKRLFRELMDSPAGEVLSLIPGPIWASTFADGKLADMVCDW
jgi:hypothetical protein